MLKAIGHHKVQLLDGGFQNAEKAGFPIDAKIPEIKNTNFKSNYHQSWQLPLVNIKEVENYSKNNQKLIIDVREKGRYDGDFEPIDLVAGHIPNAINIPFQNNLDADGFFLKPKLLQSIYQEYFKNIQLQDVIIHCGSGVTACHTILALQLAGFDFPYLYVGSWSEWSRKN